MRPFKLESVWTDIGGAQRRAMDHWIDLDHVLAVSELVASFQGNRQSFFVTLAFRNEPLESVWDYVSFDFEKDALLAVATKKRDELFRNWSERQL